MQKWKKQLPQSGTNKPREGLNQENQAFSTYKPHFERLISQEFGGGTHGPGSPGPGGWGPTAPGSPGPRGISQMWRIGTFGPRKTRIIDRM